MRIMDKLWTNIALFDQTNYATPRKKLVIARNRSAGLWVSSALGAIGRRFEAFLDSKLKRCKELQHNQPSTVLGSAVAILVFLGIYIFLLNTYKQ